MTPAENERWKRIDGLFAAALDLAPRERKAFLDTECGDDPTLRDAVRSLLDASERSSGFLEGAPVLVSRSVLAALEDEAEFIAESGSGSGEAPPLESAAARYHVLRAIGRGGTGSVFLAERVGDGFRQKVALKVIRRGLDTEDVLRRFRVERRILASLSHPNIARLLDGGETPDGRPFLVVEHVDGSPITRHCDRLRLDLPARLRLFLGVTDAVQHAHRSLVLHRDLKPSNILVDADGAVRLVDFGIAKILTGDEQEAPVTRTGFRPMTPEYASPEQVTGGQLTTASDVYQLGVLLYRLVTGVGPYEDDDVERAITEGRSRRASEAFADGSPEVEARSAAQRADPARMRRALRGDLDTVVARAMALDPGRRYGSAAELGEDVERVLSGRPIRARPEDVRYRLRMFVRRRPVLAASTLTALVALVVVAGGYALTLKRHAERLGMERDRAYAEAERADRVADFLAGLFGVHGSEGRGDTLSARTLLDRGAEDARSALADQPETQLALLGVIGRAYSSLGLETDAVALLEEAAFAGDSTLGVDHPVVLDIVQSLAAARFASWHFEQAETLYRRVFDARRRIVAEEPGDRTALVDLAGAMGGLAKTFREVGKTDSAALLMREALELRRGHQGSEHPATIGAVQDLAFVLRGQGRLEEAEALYREAIQLERARSGVGRLPLVIALNNLAYLLRVAERYEEAEATYAEALDIATRELGEGHDRTLLVRRNLARVVEAAGDTVRGRALYEEWIEVERRNYPPGHWRIGRAMEVLATSYLLAEEYAEAADRYGKVLALYRETLGEENDWTDRAAILLGASLVGLERYPEAEPLLLPAIRRIESASLAGASQIAQRGWEALALLYDAAGRGEEARSARLRASGEGAP